jgi:hypothetical protein
MKYIVIFILTLFSVNSMQAQDTLISKKDTVDLVSLDQPESIEPVFTELKLKGKVYSAMISDGDTMILADLDDVSITSLRKFDSDADYRKYLKFRRYAAKVFPYAKEAIRIFREVEYASEHLSKKDQKKKIKQLEKELKAEFEEPLKKLTKLQGKIMMKMIEKETGQSMYDLMKSLRGRFTAFYWNQFSKLYSYDLKEGYEEGKYEILDAVLKDFDLSYRIEKGTSMKYIKIDELRRND